MKKSKEELVNRITYICKSQIGALGFGDIVTDWSNQLLAQFGIPISMSNDILTLRVSAMDYEDYILFDVLQIISDGEDIHKFFTDTEIERYSDKKYQTKTFKFPIKWKMIQVTDDQWLGKISAKELMKLRSARLINYNENTQRPLTRKTVNGEEYYHITINELAVKAITESYKNGTYISNTITLNIGDAADFYYDEETGTLVIRELSAFDILDGYHRYVALQRICMEDKSFDYEMELRVVSFPEEKAKQFIWQEDQKTKMAKIDSDSMNQNNIANQVVSRLNQKAPFSGLINNSNGKIDASYLSILLNLYFCKDVAKKQTRSEMIALTNKVYNYFSLLVDDNPTLLDKKWSPYFTVAAIHCIYKDIPDYAYNETVKLFADILKQPDSEPYFHNFRNKQINKIDINRLEKLYTERM